MENNKQENPKNEIQEQINLLKIEIFDVIRQQEILNDKMNQLQNFKMKKLQELQILENDIK